MRKHRGEEGLKTSAMSRASSAFIHQQKKKANESSHSMLCKSNKVVNGTIGDTKGENKRKMYVPRKASQKSIFVTNFTEVKYISSRDKQNLSTAVCH